MRTETPAGSIGLFDSLKGLAASLVGIVHTRLDLLSTDIEEEWAQLVSLLILMLVALFCFGVGVILMTILIVMAFWDSYRLLVLSVLIGTFLVSGGAAWGYALYRIRTKPRLFASSLDEFSKDRRHLTQHP